VKGICIVASQRLFCTFRLGGRLFGVDILDVKEVTAETTYTRVAHAPEEVLGLVNIRGHIHLALDLRRLLGMPGADLTPESRLLLFKPAVGSSFGVVVDGIGEIEAAESSRIEPFKREEHEAATGDLQRVDLIDSLCKLGAELLVVLNPRRFLALVEQNLGATANA
jgi:purine-binding chemotaxis protein CheW